ncbi:unnamed protein product [Pocillopora meandrina]|uniref:Uncharacterized protein n=1 Tax=Pocillopora meandrina TaxID=46732 RepID=A0AAU9WJD1_9CNID|nr:unnamed protein product [Pocillopora meandrina]
MINRFKRNVDFLKSILQEKNRKRRMEKLLHASKDQINVVSEFTLNMSKKKIPLSPPTVAKLKKYRVMLRELGKRRNSLRKRRQLLVNQTGGGFWSGMNDAFSQCFKRS